MNAGRNTRTLVTFASLSLLAVNAFASTASAAVIGYWRFEGDGTGFLADSSGATPARNLSTPVSPNNATQVTLPASGAGSRFPKFLPHTALPNAKAASFGGDDRMTAADNNVWTDTTFTAEAYVHMSATNSANKSIVGHWNSTGNNRSWLFAIDASSKLAFLHSAEGTLTNTVVSSLTLTQGRDYYVAVSVNMADTSASGIRFYLQDLTDTASTLQTNGQTHAGTSLFNPATPFSIGSTAQPSSPFSGLIDEVRVSDTNLGAAALMIPEPSSALAMGAMSAALLLRRRRQA